jgi:hypothetical protein
MQNSSHILLFILLEVCHHLWLLSHPLQSWVRQDILLPQPTDMTDMKDMTDMTHCLLLHTLCRASLIHTHLQVSPQSYSQEPLAQSQNMKNANNNDSSNNSNTNINNNPAKNNNNLYASSLKPRLQKVPPSPT